MRISQKTWLNYITKLDQIDSKAAELMTRWVIDNGLDDRNALIEYSYAVCTKYGEAAAALACEMYDAIAMASGVSVPPAVPAETATMQEVAKAVNGSLKRSEVQVPQTVSQLTRRTAADTTLQNAIRDGAQYAWIPHGDTCVFCMVLASKGWQNVSKQTLKKGHAEHIHANCDCQYGVRFSERDSVAGYDPKKYKEMYDNAEGSTPQEKINYMRREQRALNPEKYREQNNASYARRNSFLTQHKPGNKVNITDQAIEKVKAVGPSSSSVEELEMMQNMNRQILTISKDKNNNNEVAMAIFEGKISSPVLGDLNSVSLYADAEMYHILRGTGTFRTVILSHNHPGLSYFSLDDIGVFVENPSVKTIEIVTNAGQTWYLTKKDNYDDNKALDMYFQAMKDNKDNSDKAVDVFLKSMYHMIEKN